MSSARFANVAFSNGSLLQSFDRRMDERQPLVIPQGIKRFFVSQAEAGAICVLSGILAEHRNFLVPSSSAKLELIAFEDIVEGYLEELGLRLPSSMRLMRPRAGVAMSYSDMGKYLDDKI